MAYISINSVLRRKVQDQEFKFCLAYHETLSETNDLIFRVY